MNEGQKDTVIDLPTEQRGKNGSYAAEYAAPATTAPAFVGFAHLSPPVISSQER